MFRGLTIETILATLIIIMFSLALVFLLLRALSYEKASRIRSMIQFLDDGISLAKPLEVEFGFLRACGYYSKHYQVVVDFEKYSKALVDKIPYSALCSGAYLLATDSMGVGYLIAPAVKVTSPRLGGVAILCLDPSKTPRLSKSIVGLEGITSEVSLVGGKYVVRASWTTTTYSQWRVVYDEKKGIYTITTTPKSESRLRGATLKLCVKSRRTFIIPRLFPVEICSSVLEIRKPGEEVVKELEGLPERRIIVESMNYLNLARLASTAGVTTYPHISGYAEGMIKAKLTHDIPLKKDVVVEEEI